MKAESTQVRFKGDVYDVNQAITTGKSAIVYKTTDGPIIKQYKSSKSRHQLERDVLWLKRLNGAGFVPELLDIDEPRNSVMMTDCGEPISSLNAPDDWEAQLTVLMDRLHAKKCFHNDLSEHEILVKNGRLSIVDFGFGHSLNEHASFPEKVLPICKRKPRFFLDDHIVNYVRFKLFGPPPGSEPHCFVLWKAEEHEQVQEQLSNKLEIVRTIVYMPEIVGRLGGGRDEFLRRFYSYRPGGHGDKARSPFVVYFVLDRHPHYEVRTNPSRGSQEIVNTNVFDLKHRMRRGRSAFLHGSDNIQECFDNLEALTVFAEEMPKAYWMHWRPKFASVSDFFVNLNNVNGLEYLVLRNFDSLKENKIEKGADIDILVNDYYLFKRCTGAIGYKHRGFGRPGPAHEYGGYKVAGYVEIGGRQVSVDIRCIGDGYYDERWERDMLSKRVRCKDFYIPNRENYFYSLLYHALVHKRKVRSRYRRIIGDKAFEIVQDKSVVETDEQLWSCLDSFMRSRQYEYTRPSELSIALSTRAKTRMGITTEDDLKAAIIYANRGQKFEAIDLLQGILLDEPNNVQARRRLWAVQRAAKGGRIARKLVAFTRRTGFGTTLPELIKGPIRNRMRLD